MKELLFAINPLQPIQDDFLVAVDKPHFSISNLFMEGGLPGMIIITLFLIALFIAAWKAPRWVKEIGIFALGIGFLGTIIGIFQALDAIHNAGGSVPQDVVCGGLELTLITLIYGTIIYLISVVIRMLQKPRL